ncbi:hypothetical protein [Vibrio maritimus]|uniref:hypothetical protein n=1 Tax=Vibrio maritimus TaxID=990268 RepID=UPI0037365140
MDDNVERCNLIHWSHKFQDHVFLLLTVITVDGKPFYVVETLSNFDKTLLQSEFFRTIKQVKAHLKGRV